MRYTFAQEDFDIVGARLYRRLALAATSILSFSLIAAAAGPGVLVRVGHVSGESQAVVADKLQPLARYLESRVPGIRVEILRLSTIDELMRAVDEKRVDFAFCTPSAFIAINARHDTRILATVLRRLPGGTLTPWMASAVFTRQQRADLQHLEDARRQRVVAFAPLALGGWLAALREWRGLGIDETRDFREIRFDNSYDDVAARVCSGQSDIGVLSAEAFSTVAANCPGGFKVLPNPIGPDRRYSLPASSRLYPEAAFALVSDVDERLVARISVALQDIEEGSPVAQAAGLAGFSAPLSYTPVETLMQELRVPPFETYGRLTMLEAARQHAGAVALVLLSFLAVVSGALIRSRILYRRLITSEAFRHRILDNSLLPIVVLDPASLSIIDCNPAAFRAYGCGSREEALGKSFVDVSAPTQYDGLPSGDKAAQLAQRAASEGTVVFEWRHRRPDATIWDAEVHLTSFEAGGRQMLQAILADITARRAAELDRKRGEEELRESEKRFRVLFEGSPIPVWEADLSAIKNYLDGIAKAGVADFEGHLEANPADVARCVTGVRMLDVNQATVDLFEAVEKTQLLATWTGVFTPESLRVLELGILAMYRGKRTFRHEIALRTRKGRPLTCHLEVTVPPGSEDSWSRVLLSAVDITARKQAEDSLRESEKKFATLFRNSPAAEHLSEVESDRTVEVNDSFERVTGYRRDEVVGRTVLELGLWHDPLEYAQAEKRFRENGRLDEFEFSFRRKDGELRTGVVSAQPIQVGGVASVVAAMIDVTERKRAEKALWESERRLEDITFSMGDWVWETDRDLVYTYSSQKGFDLFGRDIVGKTPFDFMPPDEAQTISPLLTGIVSGKARIRDLENWSIDKNGERICLLTNGVPVLDEAAALIGYRGVAKDITARKRSAEELARLATAIEQASETIVITDDAGTILYANPAFERTSGYTTAEALGENPRILKSGKHDGDFYRRMWEALGRGEVWRGRFQNRKKDGALYEEDATISPVRDASGRIVSYIAVKLDVTREVVLQAQLIQAQKMESIGRLAGGVAHDFNNLLTIINGYSHMALSRMKEGDPLREYLSEVHAAGERATGLTRQLLAFSRKQVLQPRVLDLNRVVEDMHSMLRRLVGEDVEVRFALRAESPPVHADPHQLEQVILNLAVNARDAMPGGGRLLIETGIVERDASYAASHPEAHPGRYAVLAVSDTGTGMDEATRQRIFEPFFTTKEVGVGTGLGLSMVQGIVAQSGGYVEVCSEKGHGSTFKIYLPAVAQARRDAGIHPAVAAPLGGKETVLVVEDQAEVRAYTVKVLEDYGYRVLQAERAVDALTCFEGQQDRIHLVLTDVVMPGMSGRELAQRVKTTRPGIKVLFMSGYTDDVILRNGMLTEGLVLIEKPFSPEALAGKVRAVLGQPV